MSYVVAVYLEELSYGGPEEGGWWFTCGELVKIAKTFPNEDRASDYCARLNAKLHSRKFGPNKGRRPKSSVLSNGEFSAQVFENVAPKNFPETHPHYE